MRFIMNSLGNELVIYEENKVITNAKNRYGIQRLIDLILLNLYDEKFFCDDFKDPSIVNANIPTDMINKYLVGKPCLNETHFTIVHFLILFSTREILEIALRCGGKLTDTEPTKLSPLHLCMFRYHRTCLTTVELIDYLSTECGVNLMSRDVNGNLPVHIPSENPTIIKYIFKISPYSTSCTNHNGDNILHTSMNVRVPQSITRAIVESGIHMNMKNKQDKTAIELVIDSIITDAVSDIICDNLEIKIAKVCILLKGGATLPKNKVHTTMKSLFEMWDKVSKRNGQNLEMMYLLKILIFFGYHPDGSIISPVLNKVRYWIRSNEYPEHTEDECGLSYSKIKQGARYVKHIDPHGNSHVMSLSHLMNITNNERDPIIENAKIELPYWDKCLLCDVVLHADSTKILTQN